MPENSLSQPPLQLGAGMGPGLPSSDMPTGVIRREGQVWRRMGLTPEDAMGGVLKDKAGSLGQLGHKT